jgi:hypothetical protein
MPAKRLFLAPLLCLVLTVASASAVECIRGPYLQNAALGEIVIRWELDRLGPSAVEYAAGGEAWHKADSPFKGRKHRVRLQNLRPGEWYRYRILSGTRPLNGEFEFRATPGREAAPGHPVRYTFAVFGDCGAGTEQQGEVARLLEKSDAEFALLPGDIIYSRGEEEHYDLRFFEPYKKSLPRMTFWPALGNHDVGVKNGAAALAIFDVPVNGPAGVQGERNYSFDYGNARIAAIDSNANPTMLKYLIGPWLERDMTLSGQTWKFVFFHHAPYSSANHGENAKMRDVMVPFFQRAKIDIAFAGHDHSYERTRPIEGIIYIVSGNGGNRLYTHKNPHPAYTEKFYVEKHGLTLVTIEGTALTLRHVNVDGQEVDRLELRK